MSVLMQVGVYLGIVGVALAVAGLIWMIVKRACTKSTSNN